MNDLTIPQESNPIPVALRREPFVFTGTVREYFGIWIINILLTIVTLGIYSAWAKVRRQRYFYGNTWLAGANFEYHARPMQILIGRLIVVSLLALYNLAAFFLPIVSGAIAVVLLLMLPWFVSRGMRFNARVTSYRNVRFDFTGTYGGGFLAYLLGGALIYGTGGILAPLASQWMWNYSLGRLRYGTRPIQCDPRLEKLYGQWWLPALLLVGGVLALMAIGVALFILYAQQIGEWFGPDESSGPSQGTIMIAVYALLVPFLILYAMVGILYRAGTRNVALNETIIDGRHVLSSRIHRGRYLWIAVSNLVATLCTFGLLRPWAAIRMASYIASVTALDATSSLEEYFGTLQQEGAAIGAEYMDVGGFDIGF